jgi:hypothetical protein
VNETVEVVASAELALQARAVDETDREVVVTIMLADLVDRHACRDGPSSPLIRLRDGTASLSANSPDTSIFKATVRFPRPRRRPRIERLAQIAAIRQIQRHQSRKQRRLMFVIDPRQKLLYLRHLTRLPSGSAAKSSSDHSRRPLFLNSVFRWTTGCSNALARTCVWRESEGG